ncbi:four helix bundle protein [Balneola sp. MJW-20]|uniref:four helix bundle protein n=1 Tax=Gracilimonas aurantiaca TaxID=3234185 RepID=UPI0038B3CE5A
MSNKLPDKEKYNINSQIVRAATSVALNIAEGSTSQSDSEQQRFISYSIRSLLEVIACLKILEEREYAKTYSNDIKQIRNNADTLFISLQAFRKALK